MKQNGPTRCIALSALIAVSLLATRQLMAEPRRVAAELDRLLAEELLDQASAELAPLADDQTFLRRVFLDLVGEPPTPDDFLVFALDQNPDRRAAVVQKLLADRSYAENWARYWRDVIMSRRSEDRALIAANALTDYLTDQFHQNTAWDQIVRDFITAAGDVRSHGETALIMAQAGRPEDTVAEVSRIFLGIQIQCAQCHDHPTDRWNREQFHQLAAFFPRVAVRPSNRGGNRTFLVVANDGPVRFRQANNNRSRGTPEHYMPDLDDPGSKGTLMNPVFFVNDNALSPGVRDATRRAQLARWMTAADNPWFARALVNRIWSELVGEGFYEPVDDLGPDRQATAPRTLDYLATSFTESGYDLKWLMTTIMASSAYQRQSRSRRQADETPFLANCPQRLRGDQLYSALTRALGIDDRGRGRSGPYGRDNGPRTLFNIAFGYDPSQRRDEVAGSIPQALLLMNSPILNQAISARRISGLGGLLQQIQDNRDLTVELYLRTLARQPSESELKICLNYVREVEDRSEAFEDILWSLINSTEFLYRN